MTISGTDVPKPTRTIPIIRGETPKHSAVRTAPRTKSSPPTISRPKPTTIAATGLNSAIKFNSYYPYEFGPLGTAQVIAALHDTNYNSSASVLDYVKIKPCLIYFSRMIVSVGC